MGSLETKGSFHPAFVPLVPRCDVAEAQAKNTIIKGRIYSYRTSELCMRSALRIQGI